MSQTSKKNSGAASAGTKKADKPKSITPDVLMPEEPAAPRRSERRSGRSSGRTARGTGTDAAGGGAGARPCRTSGPKTGRKSSSGKDGGKDGEKNVLEMDVLEPEEDAELDGDSDGTLDGTLEGTLDGTLDGTLEGDLEGDLDGDLDDLERNDFEGNNFEGNDLEGNDLELEAEDDEDGEVKYLDERPESASTLPVPAGSRLPQVRDNFQLYVREVCRFPLLKPDEEHDLAVRFRDTQDKDAAFKLVSSHLRLVVKIAMDFQRRWMQNVLDLVQEGNVGLLHALYKFDPDKGIKFSYYSSFWIKAYILKFIMDNFRMVKIGTTQVQRKLFFNLNRERQKLVAQGFNPDAEMLSRHLGVSTHDILEMEQRLSSADVSLNVPVGDENDSASRIDFLPALDAGVEESIANSEISEMLHEKLKTLLPKLSEKELYILENRLFTDSPETLREIGERYHITRERVRQLEIRLLEKIKQHLSADIKDFSNVWIRS